MGRCARARAQQRNGLAIGQHGRLRLDAAAVRQRFDLAAGGLELPQVPAVDVARVGGVDDAAAVAARGRILDLKSARGQQPRLPAGRRHGVEVQPAIVLRREDDGVIPAPVELLLGAQGMEYAARAFRCAVDLGHTAVGGIGDANRPWWAGAVGDEADLIRRRRQSQERNAAAIGRPARFDVEGQAGIEPAQ